MLSTTSRSDLGYIYEGEDRKEVTSICIPVGTTRIGKGAFDRCTRLASISITGGVESIGVEAFLHCDSLTCISLPHGITSIGDRAFFGCGALTSILLPTSLQQLGHSAFSCKYRNCLSISNLSSSSQAVAA